MNMFVNVSPMKSPQIHSPILEFAKWESCFYPQVLFKRTCGFAFVGHERVKRAGADGG